MSKTTVEYKVNCKRCGEPIGYSGMMYEKMSAYGQSRPEYCESCKGQLILEKMTMGAAYFSVRTLPGEDLTIALPGELGMVYHPQRPHVMVEKPATFDEKKFGATPDKIVDIYRWLKDKNHQVAIVIGETGSGKSTALPYWLIYPPEGVPKDFFTRDGQILITQPRIVATTSISEYMGTLLGSTVGKGFDIGYRYSKDRNADRFNAAFFATDGSLINMIAKGQLSELSVIMIDEAHERSENIDIILRLLKDQLPLYPHLKLLIVSATINKELFLNYFGKETAAIVEFEAKRKFDYKVNYATEAEKLPYDNPSKLRSLIGPALVKKTLWLLEEQVSGRRIRGNVLAFLQGVKPIEEAVAQLKKAVAENPKLKDEVEVLPLYSDLDKDLKDIVLSETESKKIRVIVSTNVAEASVTVPGLVYVVETGIENQANWNASSLETNVGLTLISQANARQRWGRSGRKAPGEVFTLYTEEQYKAMLPFPIAAIQRTSMEEIILLLKKLGVDELDKGWIEDPNQIEFARAMTALRASGALDEEEMITEYGLMLKEFAYTASLTDLIVLSDRFGCAVEVATMLPVIKNGGKKQLLLMKDEWDRKEREKAEKAHKFLQKNCRDDVEFILKLYSLWMSKSSPKGKNPKADNPRANWAKEFYVNHEALEEIDAERNQILKLLNSHKKDSNFRDIDFNLLDRVRIVLAYCIPYKEVTESGYSYSKLKSEAGTSASYQMALEPKKNAAIEKNKADKLSLFSLARELVGVDENPEADDEYRRIFEGSDLSLEEAIGLVEGEWEVNMAQVFPIGLVLDVDVKTVIPGGIFVTHKYGVNGYISVNDINKTTFIKDATKITSPGEVLRAKVIGYDKGRKNLQLSLAIPENNPLINLKIGDILEGKVMNFADFGTFVNLKLGYQGLIHISEMGKRVNKPTDILALDDLVKVEVIKIAEDKGVKKIGLRLKSIVKKA